MGDTRKVAEELVAETIGRVLHVTADAVREAPTTELQHKAVSVDWADGYIEACRFLAKVIHRQADILNPPKAPEPQPEFREGDWVEGDLVGGEEPRYWRVVDHKNCKVPPRIVIVERSEGGHRYQATPRMLRLVHRCPSRPTGPPVVGSYVSLRDARCPAQQNRGIVDVALCEGEEEPFRVHWSTGGNTRHKEGDPIHLSSPEDQA